MNIILHKDDLPDNLEYGNAVGIDTETMGLRPHRDRLCVVQVGLENGECHIVQISADDGILRPNLSNLLENHEIVKIFHYARFDVAVLANKLKVFTNNIYCTKIASRLARTFTDRHGLKDLCKEMIGVELNKQTRASDWGSSHLTEAQLHYAASDVFYLHRLRDQLNELLVRERRLELALACFDFIQCRAALDLLGMEEDDIFGYSSSRNNS